ncbi:TonB-dependent siderophore receptor [Janthinobacterium agaricidamnosum]|uniref:TonB-dependent siderophore receptor family protein n=1 Tax=Janthinobacterium agaricidamnosum NBRC 102515 = DSM 9628 TaxID=1349767 RepID=W0V8I5_9BURK|nr:TonB-dependent siderophore receptor [Janthinobacterium agaricidamnosum]CDG83910.1 tonB-dependent siderophore receptor family protein [Janthinobacterium agaricidamnosum NBRC 102515 = DSM 9628]
MSIISTPNLSIAALAVLQAFSASAAQPAAANGDANADTAMTEVLVTGTRIAAANRASVAGFSDAPLLQTPASVSVLTREQMQDLQIRSVSDAVQYDASISDAYNAVGYSEQFSIRGFALDNNSSYRKDGLAIPGDTQIPLENKERIEVLKGLSGFQSGIAAPGGIVDFIVKRPTATPLRTVTVETRERGTLYGALDVGGRFEDTRFGYRINVAAERLRSYIKGADGNRKFISGAFDWQISPQALLQIDADYQKKSQVTAPGFQLLNGTTLPTGIKADNMLNKQPWSLPVQTSSSNIGLRFQYQFNPEWHATLSANRHSFKRDDYTAFPYGCSAQNLFPGFCGNGDYDVYDYQSLGESKSPLAGQAVIQGKFATGGLRHDFSAGLSYFHRRDDAGNYLYEYAGGSNIYQPVIVQPTGLSSGPVREVRNEKESAAFVQDILHLSGNWTLHGGLRYVQTERSQYVFKSASQVSEPQKDFLLPNFALVYNPLDNVSLYGAYSQGLEHGGVASVTASNPNAVLDPNRSKQVELGAKADLTPELMVAASLFQIRKGLEYIDASNTFVRHGVIQHRGLELSAQGKASRDLSIGVSAMALNSRQSGTGDDTIDGKRLPNVAAFKSSVYADYSVPQVAGLKLNATWQYSGKKAFDNANQVFVPAYHVANLGAAYATRIGATPATLRFAINNVFDKFYWRDAAPDSGGYLFPGASRTFKASAQFDF